MFDSPQVLLLIIVLMFAMFFTFKNVVFRYFLSILLVYVMLRAILLPIFPLW